jgi:hypothetical protein
MRMSDYRCHRMQASDRPIGRLAVASWLQVGLLMCAACSSRAAAVPFSEGLSAQPESGPTPTSEVDDILVELRD